MSTFIPGLRSRSTEPESSIFHESVPFLNTAGPDIDLELQAYHQWTESQDVKDLRKEPRTLWKGSDDGHNIDDPAPLTWSGSGLQRHSRPHRFSAVLGRLFNRVVSFVKSNSQSGDKQRTFSLPRAIWRIITIFLMLLGILQVVTLTLGLLTAFFPEKLDYAFQTWQSRDDLGDLSHWPTDYTADIAPVACHSHNDYWRRIPLTSAIRAGCTGVEADVWLINEDLYVGHARSALKASRTLTSLYINPLVQILERQNPTTEFQRLPLIPRNGVFDTDASQTLILLIDFKTSYEELWPVVSAQLEPLRQRQYLTYFNGTTVTEGPVTVVVTGNAPFDYVVQNMTYRDMFFDAPLSRLASLKDSPPSSYLPYNATIEHEYLDSIDRLTTNSTDKNQGQGQSGHAPSNPAIFTRSNSYYASVDFAASIGYPQPYLSRSQRDQIAAQIAGAHAQGLKVRYWDVPNWPVGMRNYLWRELVKMGVDFLNVDDLYSATKGDWRSGRSIWAWSLWGGRDW